MGWREALFALEGRAARLACAWMCRWRDVARWVAVAISPQWPITLARQGVEHTWRSYLGGMNGIIRNPTWRAALQALVERHVEVVLVQAAADQVPVAGRAEQLAAQLPGIQVVTVSGEHNLPIAKPNWSAQPVSADRIAGEGLSTTPGHAALRRHAGRPPASSPIRDGPRPSRPPSLLVETTR